MPAAVKSIIQIEPHHIRAKLLSFNEKISLPGIGLASRLDCLVKQVMDSIQRINLISTLHNTPHSSHCTDATCTDFNPLKVAAYHTQQSNVDEAFWLVFLATHFGEDENKTKWRLVRDIYFALGNEVYWNWERTSSEPHGFRQWLQSHKDVLQSNGRFGNHRKYESLLDEHTGKTIHSYMGWIGNKHTDLINRASEKLWTNPYELFDTLYKSMEAVWRFGRTAKFDYLCMVGKLGLADIEPGSPYLQDATGPLLGTHLLFGENKMSPAILNSRLQKLGEHLNLYFGMQILEDSICNWHKSPDNYISFLT